MLFAVTEKVAGVAVGRSHLSTEVNHHGGIKKKIMLM